MSSLQHVISYFRHLNPNKNVSKLFEPGVRVGIFGGSFDPITNAHLGTALHVLRLKKLDYIIFLPASNKRRDKKLQADDIHRLKMTSLGIQNEEAFILDDYEMHVPQGKEYTYYTMEHFKELLPQAELFFIMGADLLKSIARGEWVLAEELISQNQFIVMPRDEIDMVKTISNSSFLQKYDDGRFQLLNDGFKSKCSSTLVREEFSTNGKPKSLLPDACYEYIQEKQLYKNLNK